MSTGWTLTNDDVYSLYKADSISTQSQTELRTNHFNTDKDGPVNEDDGERHPPEMHIGISHACCRRANRPSTNLLNLVAGGSDPVPDGDMGGSGKRCFAGPHQWWGSMLVLQLVSREHVRVLTSVGVDTNS
jgi:hypothetical protein